MERLTVGCNFEFQGHDMLESEDIMAGKKLKLGLDCRGTDIIGRFSLAKNNSENHED